MLYSRRSRGRLSTDHDHQQLLEVGKQARRDDACGIEPISIARGVRVWLANLDVINGWRRCSLFSREEIKRGAGMRTPLLRRRFFARRWMARTLLAEETSEDPQDLVLERLCDRCGRLHPVNPLVSKRSIVWWSASSSRELAAVAIAPARVGIDVEALDNRVGWEQIAEHFYSKAERQCVAGSLSRFLQFWTLKEACLKARGIGMFGELRSVDCAAFEARDGEWTPGLSSPHWYVSSLSEPSLIGAVAVAVIPRDLVVQWWVHS